MTPGQPAYEEIVQFFGPTVVSESGELDRRRLRERAFSNPENRVHLEKIIHPRVYAQMNRQLDRLDVPYAIVVVPLLIETGGRDLVNRVLVVDSPENLQIDRTTRRDGTTSAAVEKILSAQMDRSSRWSAAYDVIENDASEQALEEAVCELHRKYLTEAARIASEQPELHE